MKIKICKFNANQKLLVILPLLLIITTYFAFNFFVDIFGLKIGYLSGFMFYWIFWGLIIPFIILKREGISSIFAPAKKTKYNWVNIVLLIVPCLLAIILWAVFSTFKRTHLGNWYSISCYCDCKCIH